MTFPPLWPAETETRIRQQATNLDPQERPAHVQMCRTCVQTNQRPRIVFDEEGVCSACRYAERKRNRINWWVRQAELKELLDKHRRPSGYDVIVPCSGGKDSATVAHRLKHEYGMHPLCARWAPFMITDVGERNYQSFVHAGFDVVTAQPNGLLHRRLARLAFEFYGDPFQPFVYGQLAWPMWCAVRFRVPLVMFGENGEAEYGGDPAANDKPRWEREEWERVYAKGAAVGNLLYLGLSLGAFTENEARSLSYFYGFSDPDTIVGAEFHWFSYYRPWHPQANYYYAAEHCGFEANEERSEGTYSKYASLDDKLDGLHYHMAYVKFGIGRCTSDAAHEVRDGDLEREEALALVARYDGEFPERHLDECLDYLGMDRTHLNTVIERFHARVPADRAA